MYLVEKHIIGKKHKYYKECDKLSFLSKNLYNASLYSIRQHFFDTEKYLDYVKNYHTVKSSVDYKALPAKVSNQVIKLVDQNFKSFFTLLKKKNAGQFDKLVKIPKYLDKINGRSLVRYETQALGRKKFKDGKILLSKTNIEITTKQKNWSDIKEVRIVPRKDYYVIELVYFKAEKELREDKGKYCGIDIGLNNLFCVGFNAPDIEPFIINGRPLKSINQFYNKELGRLKSELAKKNNKKTSNGIRKLTLKRNNKINDYLHRSTRLLVNQIVSTQVSQVVIGLNKDWKQDINIGKRNNQNFVGIPHSRAIDILQYKLKLEGINLIIREESYTSKCSFLDGEYPKKREIYVGKRIKRGLFRSGGGIIINADLNGAYNILQKEIPNAYVDGIEGLAVNPKLLVVKSH